MEKNVTIEEITSSESVSIYSISFEMDGTTEFEKFVQEFESSSRLNGYVIDLQKFDALLRKEMQKGTVFIEGRTLVGIENNVFRI